MAYKKYFAMKIYSINYFLCTLNLSLNENDVFMIEPKFLRLCGKLVFLSMIIKKDLVRITSNWWSYDKSTIGWSWDGRKYYWSWQKRHKKESVNRRKRHTTFYCRGWSHSSRKMHVKGTLDAMIIQKPSYKVILNICMDKRYDFPDVRELVDNYGYTLPISGAVEKKT